MSLPLRRHVEKAMQRNAWHFSNEVLYDLCREHPLHTEIDVVLAKILLIGRVYAAAIERRRSKNEGNDNFYTTTVAPKIINSQIDRWIEAAKKPKPASAGALDVMIEMHGRTTQLFSEISGLEKRSLASKYLHFHVPQLFFIYDTRAVEGMRAVSQIVGRVSSYTGSGDKEYRKFAEKCSRLRSHCEAEFGAPLSPRQLDNLLLALYEK
jgi:hypothetical protein